MSAIRARRRRASLALTLFTLAAAAAPTVAQKLPVTVRGIVMDSMLSRALPGVVLLLDTGERLRTDAAGRFVFEGVSPGVHRVLMLTTGCRASVAEFDAGNDPDRPRRIVVSAAFGAGAPGDADPEPPAGSPGRVIAATEIMALQAASMVEVLRRLAPAMVGGPAGQVGAGTRLMGRGGPTISDARIPVLVVDGMVLYSQDSSVLESIRPGDVAWMEILPGALGGWSFGTGGTGGVIRVRTHRGGGVASEVDPEKCIVAEADPAGRPVAPLSR
ncbi:MAG: TonB-dependent receptor [Gemmatimonadetes bacterium]|nr:TonB-dependent receptor [Gemmatimonadota bacterium]